MICQIFFNFFLLFSPVIFKSTKIAEHILEMPGYFVIMVSNDCCKSFQRSKSCFLGHPVYQLQQPVKNRFGFFLYQNKNEDDESSICFMVFPVLMSDFVFLIFLVTNLPKRKFLVFCYKIKINILELI